MSKELETLVAQNAQMLALMGQMMMKQNGGQPSRPATGFGPTPIQQKHSDDMITMPPPNLSTPAGVYEYFPIWDPRGPYGGFFQDCNLASGLVNLIVHPTDGLASRLPVKPNNYVDDKFGFLARYDIRQKAGQTEGGVCEPAPYLESDLDFIKMKLPYGKLARSMNTIDINNLILNACRGAFDDFYIVGNWRGVSASMDISTFRDASGGINEGLIKASAIRRKLGELGSFFQQWLLHTTWTGDPAGATAQTKEFYGIYKLVNGKYSTSGLPLEKTNGANTPANVIDALSSIVVEVDKVVGDGTWSFWRTMMDTERVLYQRAAGTGMLPVRWEIYMPPMLWAEIIKHIACEMAADGCTIPGGDPTKTLNMNDGGLALFNIQARQQLENAQALTLNGRTYPVVLDETMPYSVTDDGDGNFTGYEGDVFFLPFTVSGGEQVLYFEHIDYSQISAALAPLAERAMDAKGWTDGGQYQHYITTLRSCIELQTEFQPRLIFKAPQLAARLDKVRVEVNGQWPLPYDGAGARTSWLIPPAA